MSDPTREVLFRFTGEVDPSIKKSLNEISQMTVKAQAAATRSVSRRLSDEQRISREMRQAEIADNRRAYADLKMQQQDALKSDRARAAEYRKTAAQKVRDENRIAKEMQRAETLQRKQEQVNFRQQQQDAKQAERARFQSLRSNQVVQSRAIQDSRKLDAAMVAAGGSLMSFTKGLALMGVAGEENTEKLLRSFIKIEAGFIMLRAGINTIRNLTTAWRVYKATVAAGAVARSVAGVAGAGVGGIGAGVAGGAAGSMLAGGVFTNPYIAIPGAVAAGVGMLAWGHTKSGSEKIAGFYSRLAWNLGQTKDPLLSPYYQMAAAEELTNRRQRQHETVMAAARIQALRSSEAMQLSGLQSQRDNTLLDLQGEMPLDKFLGFSPATRKYASAGYKSTVDIQRMLIAQRDLAQIQAAMPALRNAAMMTGSTPEDWQNYANGVSQYKTRIEELKTSGFTAADSLREMKLAAEEFDLAGKNKTLALALRPPSEQVKINTAMAKIRTRTANRKDILKAAPYMPGGLFPEEESWIESQFLQAPEAIRRGQEWNRRIQNDIQEGQRLAGLNVNQAVNVNHDVSVNLRQNPDLLVEALQQALGPAIDQMLRDQETIIKSNSEKIMNKISQRATSERENINYGFR